MAPILRWVILFLNRREGDGNLYDFQAFPTYSGAKWTAPGGFGLDGPPAANPMLE
jgi:hypothetical protein